MMALDIADALMLVLGNRAQDREDQPRGRDDHNLVMSQWLLGNGLADITTQDRYRALLVIENINAIEAWRSGLNDAQRRLNHLNAVWHASLRTTTPRSAPPPPRQHVVKGSKPHKTGKPIYCPQDVIRRAATAMRESMSNDWTKLARCALETVNRDDLLALLNRPPRRARRPS